MYNDMFSGDTYTKGRINTLNEFTPIPFFNTYPGENLVFEKREPKVNYNTVTCALQDGTITELDKNIIKTVAVFAPGFILSRTVKERLTLQNIIVSDNAFDSSVKRLHKYQLLDFSHIVKADGAALPTRLLTVTQFGFQLARSLGVSQRFNAIAITTAEAHKAKSYGEGCQLLTNIQKHIALDSFRYRPVIVKNAEEGAIIRPTLSLKLWNETLYCEVIRKHIGWTEDIIDKLTRYNLTLDYRPTVILCCEDEEMSRKTASVLAAKNLDMDILYTHDTASFGSDFKHFLYNFNADGNKQILEIINDEREAS